MKQCTNCNRFLGGDRFSSKKHICKNRITTYYKRSKCRECVNSENLKRYHTKTSTQKAHKEAAYRYMIKRYGLSLEEYEQMIIIQDKKCYICKQEARQDKHGHSRLNIDHCHKTGSIRKLLCHNCNTAIGHAKEDKEVLKKMIEYLEEHDE